MNSELFNTKLAEPAVDKLPASGLILEMKSSPLLIKLYIGFFILILLALALLALPVWLIIIFILIISAYFQLLFRQHLLLSHPESIKKLVFTDMDWCFVQLNNARILKATILPDTILTEHLVILNLKDVTKTGFLSGNYHLLITAHSVSGNLFWQLKRYLRFKKVGTRSDTEDDEN